MNSHWLHLPKIKMNVNEMLMNSKQKTKSYYALRTFLIFLRDIKLEYYTKRSMNKRNQKIRVNFILNIYVSAQTMTYRTKEATVRRKTVK